MAEFKYEITKEIGVLSQTASGWRKELNLVSWNGGEPKYDLRDWAPEHKKMGKGVTLSKEEAKELIALMKTAMSTAGAWSETTAVTSTIPRRTLMLFWITVSAISSPRESWSGTQKKRKTISWRSRNLLSGYARRRNASLS